MTAVNPQITDAVQPSGSAGNFYQDIAEALVNAANNAVNAQQQSAVLAAAATTQGVAMLYSLDTAATAEQIKARAAEAAAAVHKAAHPAAPALTAPHVSASGAGEIAYGMRAAMDAFASALQSLSQSEYHNLLHVLRIAATTACLAAMIAQPDKAAGYEEVLAAIRRMA